MLVRRKMFRLGPWWHGSGSIGRPCGSMYDGAGGELDSGAMPEPLIDMDENDEVAGREYEIGGVSEEMVLN